MRIIFSTLYSEACGKLNEDRNTVRMLAECTEQFPEIDIRAVVGSAYDDVLQRMSQAIEGLEIELQGVLVPFEMREEFHARRGHEIALGKRVLAETYLQQQYDYLVFVDSDTYIPFQDIVRAIRDLMDTPIHFLSFPCVLRGGAFRHPHVQLAAFVHSKHLGDVANYAPAVYTTKRRGNKIYRRDAPDGNIRKRLIRAGGKVVRVKECTTRHYNAQDSFRQYRNGKLSGHIDLEERIGFNPVTGSMPLDAQSCIAIHDICRKRKLRKALELGCGLLNGSQSLLCGGIKHLTTIDEAQKYVDYATENLGRWYPGKSVCVRKALKRGRAYDLCAFNSESFDVVLVDGPAKESVGRAQSALQVRSPLYVFHDAHRDRKTIEWFAAEMNLKAVYAAVGRGLALVE